MSFFRTFFSSSLAAAVLALPLFAMPALAQQTTAPRESPPSIAPFDQVESHRIRITNSADGPVEVSDNQGETWHVVGHVVTPATQAVMGYLASGYAQPSSISATSVHGIRIRVGDTSSAYPKLVNLIPKEFSQTPKGFGGHVAGSSGIYTDIPTGVSIFRELAPLAGNPVLIQDSACNLAPLETNYLPQINDVLVIIVKRPATPLKEIDFVNKKHGPVTVTYADGVSKQIAEVIKPVYGVGRFDGTSYTGVGAINTDHCGVITVSTAPVSNSPLLEGTGDERRGGFQIEPSYHNSQSDEAFAPMILVIGHANKTHQPDLEGTPPLFDGYIDLAWSPADPQHSWRAEVQRGGSAWQPMPKLIGYQPGALVGVTAIRLIREAPLDPAWTTTQVGKAIDGFHNRERELAKTGKMPVKRGTVVLGASVTDTRTKYVAFYVNGTLRAMTNTAPYSFTWNTGDDPDGEYTVEARAEDGDTTVISTTRTRIWVDNGHKLQ
jgi:hypothetical protein